MKDFIKFCTLIFICLSIIFLSWTAILNAQSNGEMSNKLYFIHQQLNQIEIDQTKIQKQLENFNDDSFDQNSPEVQGSASFYDYTVDGWSTLEHRVCASRDFARGTTLQVTNTQNGKSVQCLVTDYGPDAKIFPGRIIDMSSYSFSLIASKSLGVIPVVVTQVR